MIIFDADDIPKRESRKEWMLREGVPQTIVNGHAIMDRLLIDVDDWTPSHPDWFIALRSEHPSPYEMKMLEDLGNEYGDQFAGFILTAVTLAGMMSGRTKDIDQSMVRTPNRFLFNNGLADQDFTWHFSACMATYAVRMFCDAGYLSREDISQLTLTDWADVIDSAWFHDCMQKLATTSNGIYGSLGKSVESYSDTSIKNYFTSILGGG